MTNKPQGVLYVGMTNNLERRVHEHKNHMVEGFTNKYNLEMLVWFSKTSNVESAIAEEKKLKHWKRLWKIDLIEKENPEWKDLALDW
jgi:putative endonuclease